MTEKFDVIVIGGGPGGYVAAIRAAQLGLNTACIDMNTGKDGKAALGGTCLNVGCIPSKALLDSSKHYHHLQHSYAAHGINVSDASIDIGTMISRKDAVVSKLTGGVAQLFKANKVKQFHGRGRLLADRQVEFTPHASSEKIMLEADNIILAAGSVPIAIPNVEYDNEYIIDNAGVLDLTKQAGRLFKRQGLDIRLGTLVKSASVANGEVKVTLEDKNGESEISFDRLLVAVGRKPYTKGLLSDESGVEINGRGQINVNDQSQTNMPGIWAVGDCVRGPMLAHKASEEGIAVAELIAGKAAHIPWVIYTDPEIAWVGKTEQQLKEEGVAYRAGSFPFAGTGRGLAMGDAAGMVKMLADEDTDEILGVHIIGPSASELIAECVVTMEFHGAAEDLARIVHAHPTLSEAVHEAALHVDKRAIHRGN
jgi:dihydrolipoamide dehydrogenase